MTEQNLDHWKSLAEEIGAEPAPEEPTPIQAEEPPAAGSASAPAESPVRSEDAVVPRAPVVLPPRPALPRRTAGDWAELAAELGVEVPPEPEPAAAVREEEAARPREPEIPSWEAPAPHRAEPQRASHREEPRRDRDQWRRPEAESSRDEERRGRKRRKRQRRPSEMEDQEAAAVSRPSSTQGPVEEGEPGLEIEDFAGDDIDVSAAELTIPTPAEREDAGRGRGKRRRRRRGSGSRRESSTADEPSESSARLEAGADQPPSSRPEHEDSEALEEFGSVDEDLAEEDLAEAAGPRSEKSLHRAIPSWFDAVNVVVSANLESRAKNPDRRSGNRGRGGHDRRGRDRS